MSLTVAVIAPGAMGAALGRRLAKNGVRVLTVLEGRGPASAGRAAEAGMIPVTLGDLATADMILSVVPPGSALELAERLAPVLAGAARPPLYADCNAINPVTVRTVEAVIAASGAPFADAGIIGGPPAADGGYTPVFYTSGEHAGRLAALGAHGLDVRVIEGGVGSASALKMCYAGLTKGMTAVTTAVLLGAARAGVEKHLHAELAASQTQALARAERLIPEMLPKAQRWVAEMKEISAFLGGPGGGELFQGAARLYERMAADQQGDRADVEALLGFLGLEKPPAR